MHQQDILFTVTVSGAAISSPHLISLLIQTSKAKKTRQEVQFNPELVQTLYSLEHQQNCAECHRDKKTSASTPTGGRASAASLALCCTTN
jgi:hypothetical protein